MEHNSEQILRKATKEVIEKKMQNLTVKDFSCIKSAKIELTPLTIIIGPQASGKSVLSKLIYFCTSIVADCEQFITDESLSFNNLAKRTTIKFHEWFPSSAWGDKRFCIEFTLNEFNIKIARVGKSEKIKLTFCDEFVTIYTALHNQFITQLEKIERDPEGDAFEAKWKFREHSISVLRKWLQTSYIEAQLFIPAGRSFFTSIGKALVAFEHSGILDPITLEFGRRFSSIRENYHRRALKPSNDQSLPATILFSEILGGQLKSEGGKEYIQTQDGRLIPFSALSSGQQELLPLALCIRTMLPTNEPKVVMRSIRRTIYIEEPEAHLFPRAQNKLVEILAALVAKRRSSNLLLTTHSPYVLSKFNNLIKAGQLGGKKSRSAEHRDLGKVVPESSWLLPGIVNAYAIIDGKTSNIMDDTGLIAADYLDDVSGDIALEFSQLLQYEFSK